jgi:hypothetical protein
MAPIKNLPGERGYDKFIGPGVEVGDEVVESHGCFYIEEDIVTEGETSTGITHFSVNAIFFFFYLACMLTARLGRPTGLAEARGCRQENDRAWFLFPQVGAQASRVVVTGVHGTRNL